MARASLGDAFRAADGLLAKADGAHGGTLQWWGWESSAVTWSRRICRSGPRVPDERRGQAIKAFIKLLLGHQPSQQMIDEIQKQVKTRLAAHEYPREFEFIDEFPVTVTGKIRRRNLREREVQRQARQKTGR
jgi:hypothetical protein